MYLCLLHAQHKLSLFVASDEVAEGFILCWFWCNGCLILKSSWGQDISVSGVAVGWKTVFNSWQGRDFLVFLVLLLWSHTSTPPSSFMAWCSVKNTGTTLPFTSSRSALGSSHNLIIWTRDFFRGVTVTDPETDHLSLFSAKAKSAHSLTCMCSVCLHGMVVRHMDITFTLPLY
jgi:hypothetical protein